MIKNIHQIVTSETIVVVDNVSGSVITVQKAGAPTLYDHVHHLLNAPGYFTFSDLLTVTDKKKVLELFFNSITGVDKFHHKLSICNNEVSLDGEILTGSIVSRFLDAAACNAPVIPYAQFLLKLAANPSMRSRRQLYDFLEHEDLCITDGGYLLAYKSVTQDYMDHHTRTINNRPGAKIKPMKREDISDDPSEHCSYGYHVGAFLYASDFHAPCRRIVLVKVDPANVVSVPLDFSCRKCRVTHYEVIADVTGQPPLHEVYKLQYVPLEKVLQDGDIVDK